VSLGGAQLIADFVAGRYRHPETGALVACPVGLVAIESTLDGGEADLVAAAGLEGRLAVIADENTWPALGERVARRLAGSRAVVLDHPHADLEHAAALEARVRTAEALVAVGSGTLNDLVKYVAHASGRPYAVFATAPSMNGYPTATASLARAGFKVSLNATAPRGVFFDLQVLGRAPARLIRAGLGDSLCRSTAQIDWLTSHRLLGRPYSEVPFDLQQADEPIMLGQADQLLSGAEGPLCALVHILMLTGLGVAVTGTTHHGSMGEHMVSHYIDMFARPHPGSLHGEQVGVATLTLGRLQAQILGDRRPPLLRPTVIDEAAMGARFGALASDCLAELRGKSLDPAACARLNATLRETWNDLRGELLARMLPPERIAAALTAVGAPLSGSDLGLDPAFYRDVVRHARETRNRFSMLDVAAEAGLLDAFCARLC
jgi:glycerol-1-phosphate dehydrogenase [NAD(P)+]